MDSKELALIFAKIVEENRGKEVVILQVSDLTIITDYFVICSGMSQRHVQGIADKIEMELKNLKIYSLGKEGYEEGKWVLLDYGDVVVHIYQEEVRKYYELEELWADAPLIEFPKA